jgi:integrase
MSKVTITTIILNCILPQFAALKLNPETPLSDEFLSATMNINTSEEKVEKMRVKLISWVQGDLKLLELSFKTYRGLRVRFYRNKFVFDDNKFKLQNDVNAIVFYSRVRLPHLKNAPYIRICNLSKSKELEELITKHINSINESKAIYQNGYHTHSHQSVPTLARYLKVYFNLKYLQNPKTARKSINIIENHFRHLLDKPLNIITKNDLRKWLTRHMIKLTNNEINSGKSQFDLAKSTLKGAMSSLRAAIKSASEDPRHPFDYDKQLESTSLKLKIDNFEYKYYHAEELRELFSLLTERDKDNVNYDSECSYCDYFTPLTLLCIHTGLRPSHALSIKKGDIDFINNTMTIRGENGKIKKDKIITITPPMKKILSEWLKHHSHKNRTPSKWLFPSTRKGCEHAHITCYKTVKKRLKKQLSFKHFDFRIIRHTFGTRHASQTKDLEKTREAMMHKSPETTKRYAHVIEKDCSNEMISYSDNIEKLMP